MGNNLSASLQTSIPCCRKTRKTYKLLFHGIDSSGKTTLLYMLKLGEVVNTIPTIGFNVESIEIQGHELVAWDIGGRDKMRPLWRHYYPNTDGLVFLVDSNDTDRMEQARNEFHQWITEEHLQKLPILLFCNKQDLAHAWPPEKISAFFGVKGVQARVKVVGGVAREKLGVMEGLEWLVKAMEEEEEGEWEEDVTIAEEEEALMIEANDRKLSFDPTKQGRNVTLELFQPIQQDTMCPFAKAAKVWGGQSKTEVDDIQMLVRSHAQALTEFVNRVSGKDDFEGEPLDGFCIELDDPRARGPDPEGLGCVVKEMLTALADQDPAQENVMRVNYIGSKGWRFRFAKMDFFVTVFAPCYPPTSSRYAFGTGRAFLLLQPEISFARHRLPPDTPHTEWDAPKTIRDKARVAFRKAGQSYFIPDTIAYPAAEHIVKPLKDDGVTVVRWWL